MPFPRADVDRPIVASRFPSLTSYGLMDWDGLRLWLAHYGPGREIRTAAVAWCRMGVPAVRTTQHPATIVADERVYFARNAVAECLVVYSFDQGISFLPAYPKIGGHIGQDIDRDFSVMTETPITLGGGGAHLRKGLGSVRDCH